MKGYFKVVIGIIIAISLIFGWYSWATRLQITSKDFIHNDKNVKVRFFLDINEFIDNVENTPKYIMAKGKNLINYLYYDVNDNVGNNQ